MDIDLTARLLEAPTVAAMDVDVVVGGDSLVVEHSDIPVPKLPFTLHFRRSDQERQAALLDGEMELGGDAWQDVIALSSASLPDDSLRVHGLRVALFSGGHRLAEGPVEGGLLGGRLTSNGVFIPSNSCPYRVRVERSVGAAGDLRRSATIAREFDSPRVMFPVLHCSKGVEVSLVWPRYSTLRDQLDRLTFKQAREVVLSLGEALCIMHEKGVVHLDVRPETVYIGADGKAKLGCFTKAEFQRDLDERRAQALEDALGDVVGDALKDAALEEVRGEFGRMVFLAGDGCIASRAKVLEAADTWAHRVNEMHLAGRVDEFCNAYFRRLQDTLPVASSDDVYSGPECKERGVFGEGSDVYSFGVVCSEVLESLARRGKTSDPSCDEYFRLCIQDMLYAVGDTSYRLRMDMATAVERARAYFDRNVSFLDELTRKSKK